MTNITRFRIRISAGCRDRDGSPIFARLPIANDIVSSLGPPQLFREGRKRPIPCQVATDGDSPEVHWVVRGMKAGETASFDLSFGLRQRHARDRLRFTETPVGWGVDDSDHRIAEFFLPQRGNARLELHAPNGPVASIEFRAKPTWFEHGEMVRGTVGSERTLHRQQRLAAQPIQGAVFGSMTTGYDYLDGFDRVVVSERHWVRFYSREAEMAVTDYSVQWLAIAGALTLFDPDRSAVQRMPTLDVRTPEPFGESVQRACGAYGRPECDQWPSADLAVRSGNCWLGIIAQPNAGLTPVALRVAGDDAVESQLVLSPARWLEAPIRLALGETMRFDYRFVKISDAVWANSFGQVAFPMSVSCEPI